VREVFFDSGAADAMKRGAVFIDMASIPPKMAQEHAAWLKERGVGHLDAPVSGGSVGAAEGSLAIMAGGEQADFNRTERDGVWKPMGRASYIGPAGSGQIAKLANQIMVACNIASVAQFRQGPRHGSGHGRGDWSTATADRQGGARRVQGALRPGP
jgi:2-hydroxy-3-oxopropionate reductase